MKKNRLALDLEVKAYLEACKRVTEVVSEGVSGAAAIRRNYHGLLSLQNSGCGLPTSFWNLDEADEGGNDPSPSFCQL